MRGAATPRPGADPSAPRLAGGICPAQAGISGAIPLLRNPASRTKLVQVRPQRVARDEEAALHELLGALERSILVLDGDNAVVADPVELREEPIPAHLAEAGEAGNLPAHPLRGGAVPVEAVAVDLHVLRVDVEDARGVVADDSLVVDLEPDEVR